MGILANNNGKILRANQHGSVLKQNYNFGTRFTTGTTDVYLQMPSNFFISIFNPFSVIQFQNCTVPSESTGYGVFYIKDASGDTIMYASAYKPNNRFFSTAETILSANFQGKINNLFGARSDGNIFQSFCNIKKSVFFDITTLTENTPYTFFLGVALNTPAGVTDGFVDDSGDNFAVYNRYLSDSEINYAYNNRLANEYLSLNGLKCLFNFNQNYEIKTFEGNDFVCAVDQSGSNNHAKLINLPVGSLQEQLDYANENLLK